MNVSEVKIILVEPGGALNVGSIARVMKNFALHQLVLVNPQCDYLGEEATRMAVHAKDVLESAVSVATLPQALQGCKRAIATTARTRDFNSPLQSPREVLPWLLEASAQPAALIFGREDRGLSNEELNYAQKFMRIPTDAGYASLNLASAVAISCYELAQSQPHTVETNIDDKEIASLEVVEAYYKQLESLLLSIEYLYPHTASSRMEKFRQLYNRAQLQTQEVAMLRGILRQMQWALTQPGKS
ncbi:RNA methyltransferase [Plectonema cf. radiosum LEGE 06105]|uniref:tRNA (cytidine/uridine-2'-O-)-methyltransferase TrmJ n=1 Tax=Plectonema cf. radiosum LEGE 06105 TaxID=945769 RepID=A0A8J7JTF5_9CYAN|nr:RNA methyltransferase [Plectonema radiosum]MBE9212080.1 RNA methyltransferase [Plectonema cf. radiosum LEGE 06105]